MTGDELKSIRKRLELDRHQFALLLGYVGNDRNNETRIKRYEDSDEVPLVPARLAWLIMEYSRRNCGNLPHWPDNMHIEDEPEPWM